VSADVRAAVLDALARHDRALGALDFDAVAALWDEADADAMYVGEEYARPQHGWQELNSHWARLGARLRRAEIRSEPVNVRELADGVALAVLLVEWQLEGVDSAVARSGRSWVTVLLRRRPDGWRLFHYMEAPIYLPRR